MKCVLLLLLTFFLAACAPTATAPSPIAIATTHAVSVALAATATPIPINTFTLTASLTRSPAPTSTSTLSQTPSPSSTMSPTPTLPPGASEVTQNGIVTFTSTVFGIAFSYRPFQFDAKVRTRVAADRVYVYYTDLVSDPGQYVQVLHKAPADSLQQAIRQQILHGYSPDDCRLVMAEGHTYEGVVAPPGYFFASIRLAPSPTATWDPVSVDTWATERAQYQKCPQSYTEWGGQAYFMEDTRHPDRFFFFKIGQYWIYSAGPSEYGDPWQSTLRVLEVSP